MEYIKEIKLSDSACELHCALVFNDLDDANQTLENLAKTLKESSAQLVAIELFAPEKYAPCIEKFKRTLEAQNCPELHVLPLDENSTPELAGVHITALKGVIAEFKKTKCGSKSVIYKCANEEYCRTFGVMIKDDFGAADHYTEKNLEELENILTSSNFKFSDIARTWFYNLDILDWYADFNKGRTKFFKERKVFEGLLPASTGIGSPNMQNTRIQSGLIAIKNAAQNGKVFEIESPLQCGAPNYGSSFSRAIEMDFDSYKRIMVSGSASIDYEGYTAHFGDIKKQVALTMDVIEKILTSRGMSFKDTVRAVVYCMNPTYYAAFEDWEKKHGQIPHVPSYSTVCRDDLMFEVELDAAQNK